MAWNEPGGGRNPNDPWRNRQDPGQQELDEFIQKLQNRLGGLLGGDGKGGAAGVVAILLLLVLVWAAFGVYRLDQAEQGVILRLGKYHTTVGAGLHWNPPLIDKVFKVNVMKQNNVSLQATMLTEDENLVDIALNVQYQVHDPKLYFLKIGSAEDALMRAAESALRHVVGGTEMDSIITEGRQVMAQEVTVRLQELLDRYSTGLLVTKANIEDAHPPKEVKAAFDDVIKAKEDESRLQNEAQAYANGIVPEARGQAQRKLEEANAYKSEVVSRAEGEANRFTALRSEYVKAPEITRERMYLDAMEQVLSSNSKVVVDVNKTNNVLYLPLNGANAPSQKQVADSLPALPVTAQRPAASSDTYSQDRMLPTDRLRQAIENRRWEQR
ncbi:HflK protein [gamma proteobacterium HdN1]|nr:HflK protein [gamma proteobacterium HdN1]